MYDHVNPFKDENNNVTNEISFTNLISIATDEKLFDALDPETKIDLVDILSAYTKSCVEAIKTSHNRDAEAIRSNIKR